jgi:hypothetical protein
MSWRGHTSAINRPEPECGLERTGAVAQIDHLRVFEGESTTLPHCLLVLVILGFDRILVPVGGERFRPIVHYRSQIVWLTHKIAGVWSALLEVAFRTLNIRVTSVGDLTLMI